MKNRFMLGTFWASMALVIGTAVPASAMEVKVTGDPCTLTVYTSQADDATAQEMDASDFFIYGTMGTEQAVVKFGDVVGFVDISELSTKLPEVPVGSFSDGTGLADINNGSQGDAAKDIQQKLTEQGFLAKLLDYEPVDFWKEED